MAHHVEPVKTHLKSYAGGEAIVNTRAYEKCIWVFNNVSELRSGVDYAINWSDEMVISMSICRHSHARILGDNLDSTADQKRAQIARSVCAEMVFKYDDCNRGGVSDIGLGLQKKVEKG